MAHLLGSQACLDSLRQDITDVQTTVMDLLSRVGSVRSPSWKYPDKISCELDIDDLLERYSYSNNEDHCKLSHIILFELLIDRLVLLLQGMAQYCDQLLTSCDGRPVSGKILGSSMSVGLVAKKFWNKLVHVQQTTQQLQFERKTKNKTMSKMEDTITDLRDEIKVFKQALDKKSGKSSVIKGKIQSQSATTTSVKFILSPSEELSLESSTPSRDLTLSVEDVANAKTFEESSTQTYDTAFIPCEACARTQQNLIEVGSEVIKVCESQGLPSSLAKQKKLLRQSLMAAADVSRWASEQNQDLRRINDHLDNLYAQINPLEEKLRMSKQTCANLGKQIKDLEEQLENEHSKTQEKEEEFRAHIEKVVAEKDQVITDAEKMNNDLVKGKEVLHDMMLKLKEKKTKYKESMKTLGEENSKLLTELDKECKEVARLTLVESEVQRLNVELDEVQAKLKDTTIELDKIQARNKTMERHEKALQSKHDALLKRVDELDKECEQLRDHVIETDGVRDELQGVMEDLEAEKDKLTVELDSKKNLLEELKKEKKQLMHEVEEFEARTKELEQELKETQEKLQLVIEFPSIDAKQSSQSDKAVIFNGDSPSEAEVAKDMERQVMANNIRILTLEEQNEKLRKSITFLMNARENMSKKKIQEPVALWKANNEEEREQRDVLSRPFHENTPDMDHKLSTSSIREGQWMQSDGYVSNPLQPRPPEKPRMHSAKARTSGTRLADKRQSVALSAKLASSGKYAANILGSQTEQEPHIRHKWQHSPVPTQDETNCRGRGRPASPASTRYTPVDVFVCLSCDKMYNSQKHLDIHKSFCYGRVNDNYA
ncbi:coiled-coil domain-containing protein 157-like [Montipora capricornis]|uniref:coiled-coil domain-containing protein 157-like n=1 Tax=Montipora capricornis TaxID=246305 RepID=UPI0035F1026B